MKRRGHVIRLIKNLSKTKQYFKYLFPFTDQRPIQWRHDGEFKYKQHVSHEQEKNPHMPNPYEHANNHEVEKTLKKDSALFRTLKKLMRRM